MLFIFQKFRYEPDRSVTHGMKKKFDFNKKVEFNFDADITPVCQGLLMRSVRGGW